MKHCKRKETEISNGYILYGKYSKTTTLIEISHTALHKCNVMLNDVMQTEKND